MNNNDSGTGEQELPEELELPQENAVVEETPKKQPKARSTGFQVLLQKIGLSLLFLLFGMLIATLVLYLPTDNSLKEAKVELEAAQAEVDRLATIEDQYAQLQDANSKITSQLAVYKTVGNLGLLESALLSNDTTRITQQLRYVEDDLNRIQIDGFADIQQRLIVQFRKVKAAATSDVPAALRELLVLREDVRLFSENLEEQ